MLALNLALGCALHTPSARIATKSPVRSSYDSGVRLSPPRDLIGLIVQPLPPPGFAWADNAWTADAWEGKVVPTQIAPAAKKSTAPAKAMTAPAPAKASTAPAPVASPAPVEEPHDGDAVAAPLDIGALLIKDRLGEGTQSEVLLGELPGGVGEVAVKIGLKHYAIDCEAMVLSAMSGVPGFPKMLHHEPENPLAKGGFMVVELLGPSLEEAWHQRSSTSSAPAPLSGQTFLRVGREILRLLRQLHLAGFVHNDVKPANVLLGAGATSQRARLHLIDFGLCTRAEGFGASGDADDAEAASQDQDALARAAAARVPPFGTAMYASVAADDLLRPMRPADDIESLAYTLAFLAGGSLPWKGKSDEIVGSMKLELLSCSSGTSTLLTDGLPCDTAAAALDALWAQVVRSQDAADAEAGASVDYEACLAALGGASFAADEADADALSDLCFSARGGGEPSEVDAEVALVR